MTVGTVEYLSPEQARGRSDLDWRSDLYSLGLSLYHMAVGEVPFEGDSAYEVMAKQVMSALDTQKVKQRRISPEIHFFIKKMTSKDRENRFSSLADFCRTVEGYLPAGTVALDLGSTPSAAPPTVQPTAPPASRIRAPVSPRRARRVRGRADEEPPRRRRGR